jgi:hypothetical protein
MRRKEVIGPTLRQEEVAEKEIEKQKRREARQKTFVTYDRLEYFSFFFNWIFFSDQLVLVYLQL